MNSFWAGQNCFLAESQWDAVLKDTSHRNNEEPQFIEQWSLVDDYFSIFAQVPGIIRLVYPLYQARLKGMMLPLQAQELRPLGDYIQHLYISLEEWSDRLRNTFPGPVEVEAKDADSPWPTILSYENSWFGFMYMGYWTTKLILQEGLALTKGQDDPYEDRNVLLNNILRSSASVGAGIMGPYRIAYGLRVGYDFADPAQRLWIKSQLGKYVSTYAGLDARKFVAPDE